MRKNSKIVAALTLSVALCAAMPIALGAKGDAIGFLSETGVQVVGVGSTAVGEYVGLGDTHVEGSGTHNDVSITHTFPSLWHYTGSYSHRVASGIHSPGSKTHYDPSVVHSPDTKLSDGPGPIPIPFPLDR